MTSSRTVWTKLSSLRSNITSFALLENQHNRSQISVAVTCNTRHFSIRLDSGWPQSACPVMCWRTLLSNTQQTAYLWSIKCVIVAILTDHWSWWVPHLHRRARWHRWFSLWDGSVLVVHPLSNLPPCSEPQSLMHTQTNKHTVINRRVVTTFTKHHSINKTTTTTTYSQEYFSHVYIYIGHFLPYPL